MQPTHSNPASLAAMKLVDFGQLQARYQSMALALRAQSVLADAEPALDKAEQILQAISVHPHGKQAFTSIRKNVLQISRMRPSEARTLIMDSTTDFLDATRHKLAIWRKTMQRIADGEDIVKDGGGKEYIPANAPLALAIIGCSGISNFLSIIQLALAELATLDREQASAHASSVAQLRRCATLLADCEHASLIQAMVH